MMKKMIVLFAMLPLLAACEYGPSEPSTTTISAVGKQVDDLIAEYDAAFEKFRAAITEAPREERRKI